VTTDAAGSGFYGGFIIGYPPLAKTTSVLNTAPAPNISRFVEAMAAHPHAPDGALASSPTRSYEALALAAPGRVAMA